jgi:hypothetical protein
MSDWLGGVVTTEPQVSVEVLIARLGLAAVLGAAVAAVYFLTQRKQRAAAASFVATLVLLTVLLAMVSLVIGNNVARAFGLVGALSIVRFRTVVEDTRDTAFVIFAVITGMAVGSGYLAVALVGVPIVSVTAWLLSNWGRPAGSPSPAPASGPEVAPATLVVRTGTGADPAGALTATLEKYLQDFSLMSVATARQGAAIDLTYSARLRAGASVVALVAEVNRTEGVQGVEWKEQAGNETR